MATVSSLIPEEVTLFLEAFLPDGVCCSCVHWRYSEGNMDIDEAVGRCCINRPSATVYGDADWPITYQWEGCGEWERAKLGMVK